MKFAIITPFLDETEATLKRCVESVQLQTEKDVIHILVGDGANLPFSDSSELPDNVLTVSLPKGCEDTGATPRTIGSAYARALHCEALAYLDADNSWHPQHLEIALQLHKTTGADVVYSDRWICHHSTRQRMFIDTKDSSSVMVDTNTICLFDKALPLSLTWNNVPRQVGIRTAGVDRYFLESIIAAWENKEITVARTGKATVYYRSRWTDHYSGQETNPPSPAKTIVEQDDVIRAKWVYPARRSSDGSWSYSESNPAGYQSLKIPHDKYLILAGSTATEHLSNILISSGEISTSSNEHPEFFTRLDGAPCSAADFESQWEFDPQLHHFALIQDQDSHLCGRSALLAENAFMFGLRPKFVLVLENPLQELSRAYKNGTLDFSDDRSLTGAIQGCSYFLMIRNLHRFFPAEDIVFITTTQLRTELPVCLSRLSRLLGIELNEPKQSFHIEEADATSPLPGEIQQKALELMTPHMQALAKRYSVRVEEWGFDPSDSG